MIYGKHEIRRLYKLYFSGYRLVWSKPSPKVPYMIKRVPNEFTRCDPLGDYLSMFIREFYNKENEKELWDSSNR